MIEYLFKLDSGASLQFKVDSQRAETPAASAGEPAFWTRLEFNQCSNCPLQLVRQPHCPVAVDVEKIILQFKHLFSYEKVWMQVTTPERIYTKHCDVQSGLRSLLGLVMSTSACPILSRLRGLAHYHLPFASAPETLFRTAGAYLLQQHFVFKAGGKPDLELRGLDELYDQLMIVNRCFKGRIDAASEKDANMNAIGQLFFLSMAVSNSLEDQLAELRPLFDSLASEPIPLA
ncbi:MAG: hypothetical protein HY043_10050 [Verrucomicrobia bacterium]|nr:hypothetical protein [Verrucomicrobiota bacterium]